MRTAALIPILLFASQIDCLGQDKENAQEEKKLYSASLIEDGYYITCQEVERGPDYSLALIKFRDGTSVGSSMFIMKCFYDIAKQRTFKYMVNGKEWDDDDSHYFKMYFTNDNKTPLKELVGEDYSEETQQIFDDVGYLSVSLFDILFDENKSDGPSDDELVAGVMEAWKAAVEAQDLDGLMACFSENFNSHDFLDKEGIHMVMKVMFEEGEFEKATVDLEGVETIIVGNTAIVSRVELALEGVGDSLVFALTKENGVWRITGMEDN